MTTIFAAILAGLFFAGWSFLFAVMEITIEGPVGWALTAPTWRKRSKIYGAVMNGKELTGYHFVMFFLPLFLLHLPFAIAPLWSVNLWKPARELELLAYYFLLCAHWDFQWFVLNPHFGLERFRRGEIWWHRKWIGERVPQDYPGAVVLVALFGAGAHYFDGPEIWTRLGIVVAVLVAALFVADFYARSFRLWYANLCADHDGLTADWQTYLTELELGAMNEAMTDIHRARDKIAALGRARAQREQIKQGGGK